MVLGARDLALFFALLVSCLLSACTSEPPAALTPLVTEQAVAAPHETAAPLASIDEAVPALPDTGQRTPISTAAPLLTPQTPSQPTAEWPSGAGSPSETVQPNPTGCPVTHAPVVEAGAVIDLGPAPGVPPSQAGGDPLVILGTVYAENCAPLAGAVLNVWQTDAAGEYGPGHGGDEMQCCYLQGRVTTDASGHYQLNTIRPGHYKGQPSPPPAHIHVELRHPQMQPSMLEIVFAGDPYLPPGRSKDQVLVSLEMVANPDRKVTFLRGVADLVTRPTKSQSAAPEPTGAGRSGLRTFQVVPHQSEAAYTIREKFTLLPVKTSAIAVSRLMSGEITLNLAGQPALQSLDISVDLRGLASDDPQRDEKLADRWLVTDDFPMATFSAGRIEGLNQPYQVGAPASFVLHGDMTIRDVSRPMAFQVTARITGDTLIGSATGSLKMSDFGIDPPSLLDFVVVEDEVLVAINLVAQETH